MSDLNDNTFQDGTSQHEMTNNEKIDYPIDVRHYEEIIEAILFAAGHPLLYSRIGDVLGVTDETAKQLVENYAKEYNRFDESLPRGIMLLTFPDSAQLCTREEFGQYIRDALGIKKGGNLSQSSIETLAIIAYNEPVTRTYIETIRGVDTTYTISSLVEKNLIEPCGRLDVPGRPLLYRTTPDFLRVFGLKSLDELPEVSALSFGKNVESSQIIEDIGEEIPQNEVVSASDNPLDHLPLFSPASPDEETP